MCLQSGRSIRLTRSEGTSTSVDPNVRGLIISSQGVTGDPLDYVRNTAEGIIDSPRGYVSLGATGIGAAIQEGTVSATTSVSRNGNISITGGTVRLGPDSTLRITPDTSAEEIGRAHV